MLVLALSADGKTAADLAATLDAISASILAGKQDGRVCGERSFYSFLVRGTEEEDEASHGKH